MCIWNAKTNSRHCQEITDYRRSIIHQTTFLSWTGFGSTTELKIVDGKVTARIFQEFSTDEQTGERVITDSYAENEETIGSHEKGAATMTIDDLYNSCAGDYLRVDEKSNTLYFETCINGLMMLCGFIPNGGTDNCYRSISIDSLDWINYICVY